MSVKLFPPSLKAKKTSESNVVARDVPWDQKKKILGAKCSWNKFSLRLVHSLRVLFQKKMHGFVVILYCLSDYNVTHISVKLCAAIAFHEKKPEKQN